MPRPEDRSGSSGLIRISSGSSRAEISRQRPVETVSVGRGLLAHAHLIISRVGWLLMSPAFILSSAIRFSCRRDRETITS